MNIEPDIFDYLETTSLEPHDDYTSEFTYAEQKQIWNRIKEQKQQIQELTNNWNELEEWVKEQIEEKKYGNDFERWGAYSTMLDKMKEIKGENSDPN